MENGNIEQVNDTTADDDLDSKLSQMTTKEEPDQALITRLRALEAEVIQSGIHTSRLIYIATHPQYCVQWSEARETIETHIQEMWNDPPTDDLNDWDEETGEFCGYSFFDMEIHVVDGHDQAAVLRAAPELIEHDPGKWEEYVERIKDEEDESSDEKAVQDASMQ